MVGYLVVKLLGSSKVIQRFSTVQGCVSNPMLFKGQLNTHTHTRSHKMKQKFCEATSLLPDSMWYYLLFYSNLLGRKMSVLTYWSDDSLIRSHLHSADFTSFGRFLICSCTRSLFHNVSKLHTMLKFLWISLSLYQCCRKVWHIWSVSRCSVDLCYISEIICCENWLMIMSL